MMEEAPVPGIRPALDTLRELDERRFMDKLALAIHDATSAVQHLVKPAKITVTIDIAPLTKQHLSEPAITIEAEISSKLPKPDGHRALFFIDEDGNPTTKQQRQRDLGLSVAAREEGAA
jgi:hypothetical protein